MYFYNDIISDMKIKIKKNLNLLSKLTIVIFPIEYFKNSYTNKNIFKIIITLYILSISVL